MFTIITSNLYSKRKLYSKRFKLEYVTRGNVKYCVMQLRKSKNVNWNKIAKLLGETKERVVVTDEIEIPHSCFVKPIDNTSYSHLVTMEALKEILSFHRDYIKNKTATLIDVNCRYQDYANILVNFFGTLRVVTNKLEFYEDYKQVMYYECGATILVSRKMFPTVKDNVLFVSPDGIILSNMTNQPVPIIIPKEVNVDAQAPIYHSFRAEPPKEYIEAIPDDLLKIECIRQDSEEKIEYFFHNFQSAIHQYCGLRSLEKIKPSYGYRNQNKMTFETIKNSILVLT